MSQWRSSRDNLHSSIMKMELFKSISSYKINIRYLSTENIAVDWENLEYQEYD